MVLTELTDKSQLDELTSKSSDKPVLILKYSPVCPVSHHSQNEFNHFISENSELYDKIYFYQVNVIAARAVSQEIAARFGIKHESPQALFIKNGIVVWNDSHGGVIRQTLNENIKYGL